MISKACAKNVKVTPRKARLVVDLVRNKSVKEALGILNLCNKKSSEAITKLLKSASANAIDQGFAGGLDRLYIKEIYANEGLRLKRMLPRAKGRGDIIQKRFTHLTVVITDEEVK